MKIPNDDSSSDIFQFFFQLVHSKVLQLFRNNIQPQNDQMNVTNTHRQNDNSMIILKRIRQSTRLAHELKFYQIEAVKTKDLSFVRTVGI